MPARSCIYFIVYPSLSGEGCQILCELARLPPPPSPFPVSAGFQLQAVDRSVHLRTSQSVPRQIFTARFGSLSFSRQTSTASSGSESSPPDPMAISGSEFSLPDLNHKESPKIYQIE